MNPADIYIANNVFPNTYQATLYIPLGTKDNYINLSPWYYFYKIREYEPVGVEQCSSPSIAIENGKLVFTSATSGAEFYYTIDCDDTQQLAVSDDGIVNLSGTYQISVYAFAEGYQQSDIVTATLVWVNPTIESDGIISMEAKKAVLLQTIGDNIHVIGTEPGEVIQLYSVNGVLLDTVKAAYDETTIPYHMHKGEVYIVRYGDRSIKYKN